MNALVHIIAIVALLVALMVVSAWGDDDQDVDGDPA